MSARLARTHEHSGSIAVIPGLGLHHGMLHKMEAAISAVDSGCSIFQGLPLRGQ
jgi:hypothetical protein